MTFEEAREKNLDDVYCTADINVHEELYNLEINEDNFWTYNWKDTNITDLVLDKAIYFSVRDIINNG